MSGGVTGTAGNRLPMSIDWPSSGKRSFPARKEELICLSAGAGTQGQGSQGRIAGVASGHSKRDMPEVGGRPYTNPRHRSQCRGYQAGRGAFTLSPSHFILTIHNSEFTTSILHFLARNVISNIAYINNHKATPKPPKWDFWDVWD